MSRRAQLYLLGVLLVILAATVVTNLGGDSTILPGLGGAKFEPQKVQDPRLRLDLIEHVQTRPYRGAMVDIFTGRPLPRVTAQAQPDPKPDPGPFVQPEPEVVFNYKFYGMVFDPKTQKKRAFFTNGEDVFILSEGEILQNRFRLLRFGNNNADVEEVSTGRRKTVPLEQPPGA